MFRVLWALNLVSKKFKGQDIFTIQTPYNRFNSFSNKISNIIITSSLSTSIIFIKNNGNLSTMKYDYACVNQISQSNICIDLYLGILYSDKKVMKWLTIISSLCLKV